MPQTYAIQNTKSGKWMKANGEWSDTRADAHEHETHMAALDHWNIHHHIVIAIVPTPEPTP